MNRLLFVCRRRESYWGGNDQSSGLRNSVQFIVDLLITLGVEAQLVDVIDSNSIDREVALYQPSHVILEAFWCPPAKIAELKPLHPNVAWIVRDHSQTAFLSNEGIAYDWIAGYLGLGVEIMCNSERAIPDMQAVATFLSVSDRLVTYGPNYYPRLPFVEPNEPGNGVDIGCFGAVRPLKNQMIQAIAAVAFSRWLHQPLRFHMNTARIEGGGNAILKNLRNFLGARLIEHDWLSHDQFMSLLQTMDMAMQVSFSETFNIVAADAVSVSVPVVVSPEIDWIGGYAQADPTNFTAILETMKNQWARNSTVLAHQQRHDLFRASEAAERVWAERFA
jgi:hypothetical protein